MPTIVLVGGPADGRRYAVPTLPAEWCCVAVPPIADVSASTAVAPLPGVRHVYVPVMMDSFPEGMAVYRHQDMSDAEVMLALVAGYQHTIDKDPC
jgi:hypothetical protein